MVTVMKVAVAASWRSIVAPLQRLLPILSALGEARDDAVFGCGIAVTGGTLMTPGADLVLSRGARRPRMAIAMTAAAAGSRSAGVRAFAPLSDQFGIQFVVAVDALAFGKRSWWKEVVGQGWVRRKQRQEHQQAERTFHQLCSRLWSV